MKISGNTNSARFDAYLRAAALPCFVLLAGIGGASTAQTKANDGTYFVDPATGMEFVFVKGGTFAMGDLYGVGWQEERPVHEVTVSDFFIGKYEVTQAQWEKVMGYNNSKFQGADHPVDRVSWNEIQEFVEKLRAKTGVPYRLPTEAEWEFAARGGTRDKWAGTNDEAEVGDYAWYLHNSNQRSHPVGTKKPNRLGIHDMSGSLWEWVHDRFNYPFPSDHQTDPQGPDTSWKDDYRTYKGGAWDYIPRIVRVSSRSGKEPDYQRPWIGFRLARDVDKH